MEESGELRVATFNIQHGAKGDYGRGYPELVAEACKELNVDILGLQEVDVGVPRSEKANLAEIAAEATGMNYVFAKARTFRGRGQYGNALLARGEIYDVEVAKLKGDHHRVKIAGHVFRPLSEPRNAIIATVAVNGHELAVGVTHVGGEKRRQQLGRAAAALASRPFPQILLGDFNLTLAAARQCIAHHGLEALKGPPTCPSWEPRHQIDHIALSGLRLCKISTHSRLPISDHLALVAKVEVSSQT